MAETRTSLAVITRLLGDWRGTQPMHRSLHEHLRLLILDGKLPVGTVLPSERSLAGALQVSRVTVSSAYDALRSTGYLRSVRGSGTHVRLPGPALQLPDFDRRHGEVVDLGKAAVSASTHVPSAIRRAAEELPHFLDDTGYDPLGLPHVRESIAAHYSHRGLPTTPDEILVTAGAQNAVALIAQTFLTRGRSALIETPTYPHAVDSLRATGATLIPAAVSPGRDGWDGWDAAGLSSTLRRHEPSLAYLMPVFQNPTGSSMSDETQAAVIDAARRTLLVIDETTAALRLTPGPMAPPFGVGHANHAQRKRIIHVGSVAKVFWGGLRVGWVRADPSIIERLLAAPTGTNLGTPILEQLAVAHLVPQFDAAVRERADQLRAGVNLLRGLVLTHLPDWEIPELSGGLAAWVTLPSPHSLELASAARDRGVLLPPGSWFAIDRRGFERHVRLPITVKDADLATAIPVIGETWGALSPGRQRRAGRSWAVL